MKKTAKQIVQDILAIADVKINGNRPWDIQVHNDKLYEKILAGGSIALGESYMNKLWDAKALDEFFEKILGAKLNKKIMGSKYVIRTLSRGKFNDLRRSIMPVIRAKLTNPQRKSRAHEIGKRHYDIGNNLYKNMLDKRMVYSCGYWKNAGNLDEAQEAKLNLICKKIGLKPGQRILDIGCGWGSFVKYAAEKYKAEVVGITVSEEQVKLGRELCKGLPVEIRLQDYRDIKEKFDHIISVGMFEHVGYKNYKEFMEIVNRSLKPNGLFLLHTIGANKSVISTEPWLNEYIFPNSMLPSLKQIYSAAEGSLVLEDLHSFGPDYDTTLMAWHRNFTKNWNQIKENGNYDERFYRMWTYYLLSSAGSFRTRKNQLWQFVFSKNGIKDYQSIC